MTKQRGQNDKGDSGLSLGWRGITTVGGMEWNFIEKGRRTPKQSPIAFFPEITVKGVSVARAQASEMTS